MLKSTLPLLVACVLALSACSSGGTDKDDIPDLSQEALYDAAKALMSNGEFDRAKRYLEALDTRYPFGELSDQIQLDLIYVYYKERDPDMTSAAINRYLRLNPTSQYIDYVKYMHGLCEMQKRGDLIQDFLRMNRSQKDPEHYYTAIAIFKDLIETHPYSTYVNDARQRIIYMKEQLAERELAIARYYFKRGAYLSSVRHCQSILYSYRDTSYIEAAMRLMQEGYEKLGLKEPAENMRRINELSFG
ncbi:MAG: outer membrane protein assembly factor BamD [Succinivibrio sp.]|nr:outer membrane protein assembly factor BamD [Succinivibrio sp.]